jgi:hypothetical protein
LLYTFYECRTHIQILVQEILYRDTSSYVEAVKLKETKELDRHTFDLFKEERGSNRYKARLRSGHGKNLVREL